jgi:hypothetical protein
VASRVTVRLVIGDTPVGVVDFAVLYFQEPSVLSAARAVAAIATTANVMVRALFILMILLQPGFVRFR